MSVRKARNFHLVMKALQAFENYCRKSQKFLLFTNSSFNIFSILISRITVVMCFTQRTFVRDNSHFVQYHHHWLLFCVCLCSQHDNFSQTTINYPNIKRIHVSLHLPLWIETRDIEKKSENVEIKWLIEAVLSDFHCGNLSFNGDWWRAELWYCKW